MIPHRVYEKKWRVPEIGYFQMSNIGCFSFFFIFEHVQLYELHVLSFSFFTSFKNTVKYKIQRITISIIKTA